MGFATTYWIERNAKTISSVRLNSATIASGSFEAEVRTKHAVDPDGDLLVIPEEQAHQSWVKAAKAKLRSRIEESGTEV